MKFQCPKCKSSNITVRSKSKYFRNSAICLVVIVLCYLEFNGLSEESDVDRAVLLVFFMAAGTSILCLVGSFYYFIKALLIKETIYKCEYCKSRSRAGLILRKSPVGVEILLKNIRKVK